MRDPKRIQAVLRVRRIQEQQAAAEMARAQVAVRQANAALAALHDEYRAHNQLDAAGGEVPSVLDSTATRSRQAESVRRGRRAVNRAIVDVEERRIILTERSKAVKGLEKLEERLADETLIEVRRAEVRDQDEFALRDPARHGSQA